MTDASLPAEVADLAELRGGFTVAALCRRWRIGADKVRAFLRTGQLVGVNLATNTTGRAQWRIPHEAVERFENLRSSTPEPRPTRRPRRQTGRRDRYP
jgi:hypothetical protein